MTNLELFCPLASLKIFFKNINTNKRPLDSIPMVIWLFKGYEKRIGHKGVQRAGAGRPARRSQAHGPARGGPLIYLRLVGPQARQACGPSWRGGVKIKIIFNFEGKGIRTPSLMDPYGS